MFGAKLFIIESQFKQHLKIQILFKFNQFCIYLITFKLFF